MNAPFTPYIVSPESGQPLRWNGFTWVNETGDLLGTRFFAGNGTAAAPSFTFAGDMDTGMYTASGAVRFSAGGVFAMSITSAVVLVDGTLQATNATVTGTLSAGVGAVGTPSIANAADANTGIWFPDVDAIAIAAGGVEAVRYTEVGGIITASGGGVLTPVRKPADETRSGTTTITADDTLAFAMAANSTYHVRGRIPYTTDADADFKYDWHGPTGTTLRITALIGVPPATGNTTLAHGTDTAIDTARSIVGGTDGDGFIDFEGEVTTSGTAGDFEFRWAPNANSGQDTTVRAGSRLEYQKIA